MFYRSLFLVCKVADKLHVQTTFDLIILKKKNCFVNENSNFNISQHFMEFSFHQNDRTWLPIVNLHENIKTYTLHTTILSFVCGVTVG